MATELKNKLNQILNEKTTKIIPENIKDGVTIFDVTGTLEEGVDTSDANATANDIVTNKTAYVNGQKLTGTYTGIVPTGTKQITENGTVDVSNFANAEVNVSGGKNTQFIVSTSAYNTTTYYYKTGLKITVGKTGTYKITWKVRRENTNGISGSQIYINNVAYGTAIETWQYDTYYKNGSETQASSTSTKMQNVNVLEHVPLTQGQEVEIYAKTYSSGAYIYAEAIIIEEE